MSLGDVGKFLREQPTAGRVLIVVYVVLVVVASCFVRESKTSSFYKAARELGANTRLTEVDLRALPVNSIDDRLRLKRARDQLVGQYLARGVRRGEAIDAGSVLPWPDLRDVPVTPVQLGAEPDQRIINQGTTVEVSIGDTRKQLQVLAVVSSDTKWFVLFRKAELGDISKDEPKLGRVLSLPAAAGPAQDVAVPQGSAPAAAGKGK